MVRFISNLPKPWSGLNSFNLFSTIDKDQPPLPVPSLSPPQSPRPQRDQFHPGPMYRGKDPIHHSHLQAGCGGETSWWQPRPQPPRLGWCASPSRHWSCVKKPTITKYSRSKDILQCQSTFWKSIILRVLRITSLMLLTSLMLFTGIILSISSIESKSSVENSWLDWNLLKFDGTFQRRIRG